jgi:hypothetical protein
LCIFCSMVSLFQISVRAKTSFPMKRAFSLKSKVAVSKSELLKKPRVSKSRRLSGRLWSSPKPLPGIDTNY